MTNCVSKTNCDTVKYPRRLKNEEDSSDPSIMKFLVIESSIMEMLILSAFSTLILNSSRVSLTPGSKTLAQKLNSCSVEKPFGRHIYFVVGSYVKSGEEV